VDFLPSGPLAAEWVFMTRDVLDKWNSKHPGYKAHLTGGATEHADAKVAVMAAMRKYLGAVLVAVMAVTAGMFGSIVLPFRLAFTLLFTLGATYGVAIIVYQTPLLHGTFPWLANYYGICFEAIPMISCVAVALGMDYDIFLVSRIVECKMMGLSDEESITQGVVRTGNVISGAGLVMALSFSGLFFSDKLLHHQIALMLTTSVLLDAFVVRTVLVPATMLMGRSWTWWPRKFPDAPAKEGDGSQALMGTSSDGE